MLCVRGLLLFSPPFQLRDSDLVPTIFIDADACPVKEETIKIALRHQLRVHLVSNNWQRGETHPLINRVVVPVEPDAADSWIAQEITAGDICVTNDIPLAAQCLDKQAHAVRPNGEPFSPQSIGTALAMRDLMAQLRETGEITGGPSGYSKRDRTRFMDALERMIRQSIRQQS
jgi:uncharacterized protein YaiI (UPF0178 family)